MTRTKLLQRAVCLLLCMALIIGYVPVIINSKARAVTLVESAIAQIIADNGTAMGFETMMGTDADGNRYAGRVWADKSVYKDGDTAVLNSKNNSESSFEVSLEDDEAFQIVFSVLGSTMSTTDTVTKTGPVDVVLVLDNSGSMTFTSGGTTRMQKVITAANDLLEDLLAEGNDIRLGVAAYSRNSSVVLPFGRYTNGVELRVNSYTGTGSSNGVITAYNSSNQIIDSNYKSEGYVGGTNIQAGFTTAMEMLSTATDTQGRKPVVILLTDGAANTGLDRLFDNDSEGTSRRFNYSSEVEPSIALSTLLSTAYNKARIEKHYGRAAMVYGVGVDLSARDGSNAIIDPKNFFNDENVNSNIREAYGYYVNTWLNGNDVSLRDGGYNFFFGHEYPAGSGITDKDVADNINYVDSYYPVTGADLGGVFEQIYQEITSGAFNPISSSFSSQGGTGVDDTPLIYVDFIGQHMEIKEIQAITLFGASYGVVKNANGTYTVTEATGTNPTTNEEWNTARDIRITVTEMPDNTQKLEIRINQEILPIILEKVASSTVGNTTSSTITEYAQTPLRVYYTVGIDSDILLPDGDIDISMIKDYEHIKENEGIVSFYSNQFGVGPDKDNPNKTISRDAHIGFQPSMENRYYFHQTNQGIFTGIKDENGNAVTIPENNEYGILWQDGKYSLSWMTYDEYNSTGLNDKVYTYVTYYRPTESTADAANAAQRITYLVYTEWKYLKESAAFYDAAAKAYLNNGEAIPEDDVDAEIAAYTSANPNAEIYAVLGVNSLRTSRLHNMMRSKAENLTGTETYYYLPEYTHEMAADHNENSVVVWLGNNGRVDVKLNTGIAITKAVTEEIGNADDTYAITVTVPQGVSATPTVLDAQGNAVAYTYANNVLTVRLKADETVYVKGIPEGTVCEINEVIPAGAEYYVASKTDSVTVPTVEDVLNGADTFASAVVTNAPNKYGNLFITKRIISPHAVPQSVMDSSFEIRVSLGSSNANKEFTVIDSEHPASYTRETNAQGELTFEIKAAQTVEILHIPAGTAVTVTENLTSAQQTMFPGVTYHVHTQNGEQETTGSASLTVSSAGRVTAVVENEYRPQEVSVDMDVVINKNFADESVRDYLAGGEFEFIVEKFGANTPIAEGSVVYAAMEYGLKTVILEDILKNEVYTEEGIYSYKISEVKGSALNVSYDRAEYTFDVVVRDNGGRLEATVITADDSEIEDEIGDGAVDFTVTFTNTYDTAPTSLDIVKEISNSTGDTTVSAHGFEFKAVEVDANGNILNPASPAITTVFSNAAGEARLSGVYTRSQIGNTYYYLVSEENHNSPGWGYSAAQYLVTVTVADVNGELVANMAIALYNEEAEDEKTPVVENGNRGKVYFTNTYAPEDAELSLDGKVIKNLTGKELNAGDFTFSVYERVTGDLKLTGENGLGNDVTLVDFNGVLTFDTVGTKAYRVVEDIPANAVYDAVTGKYVLNGMSYDSTEYHLIVEVTNDIAQGKLVADYYFEDAVGDTVTFYNTYAVKATEYTVSGKKILHGRAPKGDEFEFELYEGGTLKETVKNKADGSFAFTAITYTKAGVYTYTVKEKAGSVLGIRYDGVSSPIMLTVTVTDVNGELTAAASVSNNDIVFENTYIAAPAEIAFNGTKTFIGGSLTDKAFTFRLYATDMDFDITKAGTRVVGSATQDENGVFTLAGILDTAGTHYVVIAEVAPDTADGIVYDSTQYRYIVHVTDTGDGQLKASVTDVNQGTTTAPAAQASVSLGFTNAIFDEVTDKEVYLGDNNVEIDGEIVEAGDELTYFITYNNYTGKDVTVEITDIIPGHTTYVEGSATHSGDYAGGHINWILNVARGEGVTVSFKVTVNETEDEGASVSNKAQITDGENIYTTNEVENPVKEPEIVPPVTGDSTMLYLILAIAVLSIGALITLGAYAKRKNEAEEI
ncbi:MAG: VWA domain-containing protein [Clostridiales bacterium]|nr:VWA domain-containing protein [Clostridiales bacterium]